MYIKTKNKKQKGFSFLEVIISLSLLFIVSTLVFVSFNSLNSKQSFYKQIDFIKSTINQVRTDAINSKNFLNHDIKFSSTSITYYDKTINFENDLSLVFYDTGTSTLSFSKISGIPNATGTFMFKIEKGDSVIATSSIIINNLGIIE